ncbi:hypothetical protein GCM10023081_46160 [Arthrobacter ginkgonis]|uniref:EthD domain-containing protein n=1 Tax=Arthrobacter ginkgonis TaxID=1630594 RepID=A0ABP7DEU7_9MICC
MYFYLLFGRRLDQRLNRPHADLSWTSLTERLAAGLAADQKIDYGTPAEGVPESKLSIFGSHVTVMTFSERRMAERAERLVCEHLAHSATGKGASWDVRGRLLKQVDRYGPSPSGNGAFPAHAAMFQVSWKVPEDLMPGFSAWYEEHLRWHSHTFGTLDARRLVGVDAPARLISYPYDMTAMYWFEQPQEVVDMCVDLVERGKRGWPDVAQWSARTLSDRSPFIRISE